MEEYKAAQTMEVNCWAETCEKVLHPWTFTVLFMTITDRILSLQRTLIHTVFTLFSVYSQLGYRLT
jgi:hypothetical protein